MTVPLVKTPVAKTARRGKRTTYNSPGDDSLPGAGAHPLGERPGAGSEVTRQRPQRADARRNRERVLEAAEALFAEEGLRVQIEQVAHRAGVGVGTVCRHFATKQALLDAVLTVMWESLLTDARSALADPDPAAALRRFFVAKADVHARYLALAKGVSPDVDPSVTVLSVKESLREVFAALVARAQACGSIRGDIGPSDLAVLCSGVAQAVEQSTGAPNALLYERYVTIVMDGLRPVYPSPLPVPAG
jgi:AcrR family transcriptional regulator